MKIKQILIISFLCLSLLSSNGHVYADILHLNRGPVDTRYLPNFLINIPETLKGSHYFLVQLEGPIFEYQKGKLHSLDAEILSYMPINGFIIRMSLETMKRVGSLSFVKWIGLFYQEYRISPHYRLTTIFNTKEKVKLIVEFFPGENLDPIFDQIRKNGAQLLEMGDHVIRVFGPRSSLFFLEHLSAVSWLDEDIEFSPIEAPVSIASDASFDDLTGYETGHKILDSHRLNALGYAGEGQIIGFSDTGLDIGENNETLHSDFVGKIVSAYHYKEADWKDTWGHGTHVAGLLVGNGAMSEGKIRSSANQSKLVVQSLMLRDCSPEPPKDCFQVPIDIGDGILSKAYDDGVRIHSNSWAEKKEVDRPGAYSPYSKSVDQFIWDHPDMLVLFPSGNWAGDYNKDGFVDIDSLRIPGTAKNCLTVGASENIVFQGGVQINWQWLGIKTKRWHIKPVATDLLSDKSNGIAAFSSRGPTRDGRIKPEVVAPGTNILSTRSHISPKKLWGIFNDDYIWSSGTSMSTPLVASAMALVREYLIKAKKIELPSAALLKALVINGAIDLYPGQFGDIEKKEIPKRRPNVQEGWGRVNTERMIIETDSRKILFYDEKNGLATAEEKEYLFEIIDTEEPISISLVYNDYPAATNTSKYLVNDLDLIVTDSQNNTLLPNGLSKRDDTNNVEGVDILAPIAGPLSVIIRGYNIPLGKGGKQPFALVASGGIVERLQD